MLDQHLAPCLLHFRDLVGLAVFVICWCLELGPRSHAIEAVVGATRPSKPGNPFELEQHDGLLTVGWGAPTDMGGLPVLRYRVSVFDEQGNALKSQPPPSCAGAESVSESCKVVRWFEQVSGEVDQVSGFVGRVLYPAGLLH